MNQPTLSMSSVQQRQQHYTLARPAFAPDAVSPSDQTPLSPDSKFYVKKGSMQKVRYLINEIMILKIIRDLPHVVEYAGSNMQVVYESVIDMHIEIYLQRYECDLCEWCRASYDKDVVPQIQNQLIYAVADLHNLQLAHLDIKLDNILLSKTQNSDRVVVKLCDFGHSRYTASKQQTKPQISVAGTLIWNPPENNIAVFRDLTKADIFSLGLVLRSLNTKQLPWMITFNRQTHTELSLLLHALKQKNPPDAQKIDALRCVFQMFLRKPSDPGLPDTLIACIDAMNDLDPSARPSIKEVRALVCSDVEEAETNTNKRLRAHKGFNPIDALNNMADVDVLSHLNTLIHSSDLDKVVTVAWVVANLNFSVLVNSKPLMEFVDQFCDIVMQDIWGSIVFFDFVSAFTAEHIEMVSDKMLRFVETAVLPVDCIGIKQFIIKRVHDAKNQ